ncbi:MAG: phenylacetate--CoA ligase family protein, partial [Deltaproteobacteria bacterium]|nr:phenylacetate--CoA ligase family protein [Deltaproteobacteria bacterium]
MLDERGLRPEDIHSVADLAKLPLLDRPALRASMLERTASAPPAGVIRKTTSGSSGDPVEVLYNAESRHWRDATRWRGYGWGGYRIGMRAFHYWGFVPAATSTWWKRTKISADRVFKRDRYIDCTPRGPEALGAVVDELRRFRPQVIIAYASGAGALARFVNDRGLRDWDTVPVLTGAEGLLAHDRAEITRAFGPAFDTYGCREVMLMASECDAHDGLHTSMENLIVELIVRNPDGTTRAARPGETGEVVITDLHNLACPMIRYVNGDLAVARTDDRCACGKGLVKIGPVQGRITETMYDGEGNAVGGLVFNILFSTIGHVAKSFQVVQRRDRSVIFKIVPYEGRALPEREESILRAHAARYLPGAPFAIEIVDHIPLTPAGKRKVVVVER